VVVCFLCLLQRWDDITWSLVNLLGRYTIEVRIRILPQLLLQWLELLMVGPLFFFGSWRALAALILPTFSSVRALITILIIALIDIWTFVFYGLPFVFRSLVRFLDMLFNLDSTYACFWILYRARIVAIGWISPVLGRVKRSQRLLWRHRSPGIFVFLGTHKLMLAVCISIV